MAPPPLSILLCLLVLIMITVFMFFGSVLKKVPENEKWVVTRLRKTTVKGPGRFIQIPFIDQVIKVDMREESTNIQDQTCVTKDLVPVIIRMIVSSRAVEPIRYSTLTKRHRDNFALLASSTLKEIVGTRMLDEVLSARDRLGQAVCNQLNAEIGSALGMRIEGVRIIDIAVSKTVLASIADSIANIPSRCPSCGAPINRPGARETGHIKCEYCGYLIKL